MSLVMGFRTHYDDRHNPIMNGLQRPPCQICLFKGWFGLCAWECLSGPSEVVGDEPFSIPVRPFGGWDSLL